MINTITYLNETVLTGNRLRALRNGMLCQLSWEDKTNRCLISRDEIVDFLE
jgi:hypothetical protein